MVIALCVMTFWGSNTSAARGFGITGGASFLDIKGVSEGLTTGYHAGITYQADLPFGFAIQPSILYHVKGTVVEGAYESGSPLDLTGGYVEVPVSFQWGPDLILFRPFLDVTPFVGYGVNNKIVGWREGLDQISKIESLNDWDGLQRLEYGLGLGIGLDVWKLQVIGRYNWNFGSLYDAQGNLQESGSVLSNVKSSLLEGRNYGGFTLTAAFKF